MWRSEQFRLQRSECGLIGDRSSDAAEEKGDGNGALAHGSPLVKHISAAREPFSVYANGDLQGRTA